MPTQRALGKRRPAVWARILDGIVFAIHITNSYLVAIGKRDSGAVARLKLADCANNQFASTGGRGCYVVWFSIE
jgi:hypothetical protein